MCHISEHKFAAAKRAKHSGLCERVVKIINVRTGVVGIVLDEPTQSAAAVNGIISDFSDIIIGRMGVPHRNGGAAVIALTVEGTTDRIGAMTGKLGQLAGVSVKSAITK